jgi:hypothetical protein
VSESDEGRGAREERESHDKPRGQRRLNAREAADRAVEYLSEMTGQEPEVVIAVEPDGGCWHVQMELLELARVPQTTDVLGCYEVEIGDDGEPQGYHRSRRYHRGYVGER